MDLFANLEDEPGSAAPPQSKKERRREVERELRAAQLSRLGPPPGWRLDPPPALNGERRIVLNCETTGLKWWDGDLPIGWAYWLPASGRRGYLPIRHRVGENLPIDNVRDWLRSLRGMEVENANMKFDLHMSRQDGVDLVEGTGNRFADPAHLAAMLEDWRVRFNLDELAADLLGWSDDLGKVPPEINDESEFSFLDPGRVAPYAVRNVEQAYRLMEGLLPKVQAEGLGRVLALERRVIPVVVEMEKNGTYVKLEKIREWRRSAEDDLKGCLLRIKRATGVDIESPDSPRAVAAVFAARGLKSTMQTPKGADSYAAAVLNLFADRDEVVGELVRARNLGDLLSNFLVKYEKGARSDGWLRFNLHQLRSVKDGAGGRVGAVSGRFSAAGDRFGGYNPQQCVSMEKQLERGWCPDYPIRELFKPAEGKFWMAADAKQIEYRKFANLSNDPKILKAYAEDPNADFHAVVSEMLKRVNPTLNRKLTKNINFMKIYGGGRRKFAAMVHRTDVDLVTDEQIEAADVINDLYNETFPTVRPLLDLATHLAMPEHEGGEFGCESPDQKGYRRCRRFHEAGYEHRGWVRTGIGRRARFRYGDRYYSALNRVISGGAADDNKEVLCDAYDAREEFGFTMRLTVHDEVDCDMEDKGLLPKLEEFLNRQRHPEYQVPILWDVQWGETWGEAKNHAGEHSTVSPRPEPGKGTLQ